MVQIKDSDKQANQLARQFSVEELVTLRHNYNRHVSGSDDVELTLRHALGLRAAAEVQEALDFAASQQEVGNV